MFRPSLVCFFFKWKRTSDCMVLVILDHVRKIPGLSKCQIDKLTEDELAVMNRWQLSVAKAQGSETPKHIHRSLDNLDGDLQSSMDQADTHESIQRSQEVASMCDVAGSMGMCIGGSSKDAFVSPLEASPGAI